MRRVTSPRRPVLDPLSIVALDTERHVAGAGWDQPPRLFALVRTATLVEREPQLLTRLSIADQAPDALTAIEQEGLPPVLEPRVDPRPDRLAAGRRRVRVRRRAGRRAAGRRAGPPADSEAAVEALARHPDRQDVRLLAAVLRDGTSVCLIRQRAHDADDAVATGDGPRARPGGRAAGDLRGLSRAVRVAG